MKREIEVELPEDIEKGWEVVKIAIPADGDQIFCPTGKVVPFKIGDYFAVPRVILRRKHNPREWWPEWVLADSITLEKNGVIRFHADGGHSGCWRDPSDLVDFSWIPEHLKRSGITIKNPWKGEQQ